MADGGVRVRVDTNDLIKFTTKLDKVAESTNAVLAVSLNEVGDSMVAVMANNIVKVSGGLSLEQVRGLMKVKRAKRGDLNYEITIKNQLLEGPEVARKLEGRRESTDFGERRPRQLVVWVAKDDELTCMDCEEMAAAGPMPIEVAKREHPKHPHCRCVLLPYVPKGKRLPVEFTTVSGTDPRKRMGGKSPVNAELTLRQMAQEILDRSASKIRLVLK
jgi:hypothetical protein